MRKMKKFLCAALTTTMVLAMAAPSFAVEGDASSVPSTSLTAPTTKPSTADTKGAIAIDNPDGKETYKAYKIFDVTYSGDNYAYSISADSPWFELIAYEVSGGEGETEFTKLVSIIEGLTFTKAASGNVYYVTVDEDTFRAAEFAAQLYDLLNKMKDEHIEPDGVALQGSEEAVAATGLELGYYFVTTTSGALCNLTTTTPSVVIHDKNETPVIEKTANVEEQSVQIGDKIPYTITGKVPNLVGYEEYTYKVSDTMSAGLTLLNSGNDKIEVTIDGKVIDSESYTLVVDTNPNDTNPDSFILTMNLVTLDVDYGDDIVISYNALVNENAANGVDPVTNTASLEYSKDPASQETEKTPEQKIELYTSKIVIDKYQTGNNNIKLKDAIFILQNEEGKYYKYVESKDNEPAQVSWVDEKTEATPKTTDENGFTEFLGLKDGHYYLVETEAPTGYNLLADRVEVFVQGVQSKIEMGDDGTTVATVGYALTTTQEVENSTGTILPSTGGVGTTIFYAAGIILMAGAVFFVVRRKRA